MGFQCITSASFSIIIQKTVKNQLHAIAMTREMSRSKQRIQTLFTECILRNKNKRNKNGNSEK